MWSRDSGNFSRSHSINGPQLSHQLSYQQLPFCTPAKPDEEAQYEDLEAMWDSKWFGPEELSWRPPEASHRGATGFMSNRASRPPPHLHNFFPHSNSGTHTPSCFSPPLFSNLAQAEPPPTPRLQNTLPKMPLISNLQSGNIGDSSSFSLSLPIQRTPFAADISYPGVRAISDGDSASKQEPSSSKEAAGRREQQGEDLPTVGTWAHRQTRLHGGGAPQHHLIDPIVEGGQPQGIIASAATPPGQKAADLSKQALQQLQQQQEQIRVQLGSRRDSVDSDKEAGTAWKWRFARRWHMEQMRPTDLEGSSPDKTEEAIAYLNAGGGAGWNMQVDRTSDASRANSTLQSMGTLPGMGSLLAHEMLLDENLPTPPPIQPGQLGRTTSNAISTHAGGRWGSETLQATREVNSLNRHAANLLEQQHQLEAAAEERWRVAMPADEKWLGTFLPVVEIDEWGTFKFLVFRLWGCGGKQRICVRGRNYCTQTQIIHDFSRKVQTLAIQHKLAHEPIEIMGGGVCEWRQERDRHLCISSGYLVQAAAPGVSQASAVTELLNLAAVLTKQSLPAHYQVSLCE